MKRKLLIPEGTKDYLQEDTYVQRKVMTDLLDAFASWGYHEIKTPMLEKWDIVKKKNFDETGFFTLTDKTGDLLVLRPEITAPVARAVATHFRDHVAYPLRLAYAGEVFSQKSLKSGKRRQYAQVGIELVGSDSVASDCEVLLMALESMKENKIRGCSLGIGHMDITVGLLEELVDDNDVRDIVKDLMIKKDIVSLEKLLPESVRDKILTLASRNGGMDYIQRIKSYSERPSFRKAVARLEAICEVMKELGYQDDIFFDFSILGDFDYYTGLVFEGYAEGVGISIVSGGRYDNLIQEYFEPKPAVGFAITVDLYIQSMDKVIRMPGTDEIVEGGGLADRFKRAGELRARGNNVQISLEER